MGWQAKFYVFVKNYRFILKVFILLQNPNILVHIKGWQWIFNVEQIYAQIWNAFPA